MPEPESSAPRPKLFARYRAKHPGSSVPAMFCYDAQAFAATLAMLALYRQRTFGIQSVPKRGPLLIVANHQSFLDPLIVGAPLCARRHLDYIARTSLFNHPMISAYLKTLNTIPIRQDEPDASAIRDTLRRIQMGRAVLIFAEGSRTPDGTVQPFKRGTALLVRRAKCPVVPLAIEGAYDTWPKERKLPRLLGCRIMARFDTPIAPDTIAAQSADDLLHSLRDRIESMRLDLRDRLHASAVPAIPRARPLD